MRLVFASQNEHKLAEIRPLIPKKIELISLAKLNFLEEIPETYMTLECNALQKAEHIYSKFGIACFADDTGLEVDALKGAPGVFSARYAGEKKSADDNMEKLLSEMKNVKDRTATFRTLIALAGMGKSILFEGALKGVITQEKRGTKGFGYDPVFMPEGYDITLAEMSREEKNKISHRAIAMRRFAEYLHDKLED